MNAIFNIPLLCSSSRETRFLKWRSSDIFIVSTVFMAVFGDTFLYSVIIPVLPFSLTTRLQMPEEKGS
jgi:hypothetical protein